MGPHPSDIFFIYTREVKMQLNLFTTKEYNTFTVTGLTGILKKSGYSKYSNINVNIEDIRLSSLIINYKVLLMTIMYKPTPLDDYVIKIIDLIDLIYEIDWSSYTGNGTLDDYLNNSTLDHLLTFITMYTIIPRNRLYSGVIKTHSLQYMVKQPKGLRSDYNSKGEIIAIESHNTSSEYLMNSYARYTLPIINNLWHRYNGIATPKENRKEMGLLVDGGYDTIYKDIKYRPKTKDLLVIDYKNNDNVRLLTFSNVSKIITEPMSNLYPFMSNGVDDELCINLTISGDNDFNIDDNQFIIVIMGIPIFKTSPLIKRTNDHTLELHLSERHIIDLLLYLSSKIDLSFIYELMNNEIVYHNIYDLYAILTNLLTRPLSFIVKCLNKECNIIETDISNIFYSNINGVSIKRDVIYSEAYLRELDKPIIKLGDLFIDNYSGLNINDLLTNRSKKIEIDDYENTEFKVIHTDVDSGDIINIYTGIDIVEYVRLNPEIKSVAFYSDIYR